jgi:hypothetical protein
MRNASVATAAYFANRRAIDNRKELAGGEANGTIFLFVNLKQLVQQASSIIKRAKNRTKPLNLSTGKAREGIVPYTVARH